MLARSSVSARAQCSPIGISCQTTIPYNDSPLQAKETHIIIKKMIKNGELKVASMYKIQEYKERFKSESLLTSQHITGDSISMPHSDWEFTFTFYFPHSRPIHHSLHYDQHKYNKYKYKPEKIYAYTTFRASYDQLQKIDYTIIKHMSSGYKYFAYNGAYPSISKCKKYKSILKKRGSEMVSKMEKEETFIKKPKLPPKKKKLFGGIKAAKLSDLLSLANYLNIIFSSPSLCKQTFVFEELSFSTNLQLLLRSLAINKLHAFESITDRQTIRDPSKLLNKLGAEYIFHTLYIVRRPVNDSSARLFNFNHWAFKLEGKQQLITVEFFAYNEKHGIVKTQILPNTSMHRRVFWFWWAPVRVPEKQDNNTNYFTTKWVNIETIYVGKISTECIGKLIIKWLSMNNNHEYSIANNNCQHFVRDLCTIFDMKIARKLNGFMDHRTFAAAIPAAALADGMASEARTNEIYNELKQIVQRYKDEQDALKSPQNVKNEQQQFLENYMKCAQELGIDLNMDDEKDANDDNDADNQFYDQFGNINDSNTSSLMIPTPSHSFDVNNNNCNNNEIVDEKEEEKEEENNGKKMIVLIKPNLNMNHQD